MFLGAQITPIKKTEHIQKNAIIFSTCYFHSDKLYFRDRNYDYLDGLIENIETFNMKIQQFTTNPSRWIYRVYIDEFVLNIKPTIDILLNKYKNIDKHKTNNDFINEIDSNLMIIKHNIKNNYKIFLFIQLLLNKYIKLILESKDEKYKNIEIFTYSNKNLQYKLYTNPKQNISGEIATYGTLLRYHPLTDTKSAVVIMRNCSHNVTPFDIIVQNYWIEKTNYEFMEYIDIYYDFNYGGYDSKKYWYKLFYNKKTNTKNEKVKKIKHFNYDRIMAGLISCKINDTMHTHKHYKEIFTLISDKLFMNKNINMNNGITPIINNAKYDYGIDEGIIHYIFPDLRKYSYRANYKQNNPKNIVQNTFAIKIENNNNTTNCNKCDKPTKKLLKTYNNKGYLKEEQYKKLDEVCDMNTFHNCSLYNLYKNDIKNYNTPFYNNRQLLYNYNIKYLRALPFTNLNLNSWEIDKLPFMVVLSSIMFKNKYTFSLQINNRKKYNRFIPYFTKEYKDKDKDNKDNKDNKVSKTSKTSKTSKASKASKSSKASKASKKTKKQKIINYDNEFEDDEENTLYDPYLVLCNLYKKDMDIDKYLSHLPIAYSESNFYPVIFYPKNMTIMSYNGKNKNLKFNTLLQPISNKHKIIIK